MKKIKYFIQFLLIIILLLIYKILGLKISNFLSGKIFSFIGPFFRSRDISHQNLINAFPNIDKKDRNIILKKMWFNYGKIFSEYLYVKKIKNSNKITVENQEILDAIKKEIQQLTSSYASGGRAGYANGEMVMEEQVTETMAPQSQAMTNNPISYDQLRARLPAEITDDIVELMTNSAEALEDFAMISSQQDVDLFNQKYMTTTSFFLIFSSSLLIYLMACLWRDLINQKVNI